ncbi:MAG: glycosyltransferase, partial [Candidatus Paceibacterota bacterium]
MRIVFTGGGTGGHFYPIIAIIQAIEDISAQEKLLEPDLYFFSPTAYNKKILFEHNVAYHYIAAGKWRRYFSIRNIIDLPKTFFGILQALFKLYTIYPDVVFSKGGYASFPTVVAAHILRIPIIIHESDSRPGRVTRLTARFAQKVALSYPQAGKYLKASSVAHTGNPIRQELLHPVSEGAYEYLDLGEKLPVLFILGGSQGAERINRTI